MYKLTEKGKEMVSTKSRWWEVTVSERNVLEFLSGDYGPTFFEEASGKHILSPMVYRSLKNLIRRGLVIEV